MIQRYSMPSEEDKQRAVDIWHNPEGIVDLKKLNYIVLMILSKNGETIIILNC